MSYSNPYIRGSWKRTLAVSLVLFCLLLIYTIRKIYVSQPDASPELVLRALAYPGAGLFLCLLLILPRRILEQRAEAAAREKAARKKQAWQERRAAEKGSRKRKK